MSDVRFVVDLLRSVLHLLRSMLRTGRLWLVCGHPPRSDPAGDPRTLPLVSHALYRVL
ncbi:MAG: hypothetical protein GYA33_01290 [Thermogutta sp.]|nr:hypothetical protein [Thermogutta sp.]